MLTRKAKHKAQESNAVKMLFEKAAVTSYPTNRQLAKQLRRELEGLIEYKDSHSHSIKAFV